MAPHKRAIRSFTLLGDEREGGYTYLYSEDLPGFTFMLEPGEAESIDAVIDALKPALGAYLSAKFHCEAQGQINTAFRSAEIRRADGRRLNIVAESCFA